MSFFTFFQYDFLSPLNLIKKYLIVRINTFLVFTYSNVSFSFNYFYLPPLSPLLMFIVSFCFRFRGNIYIMIFMEGIG